MLGHFGRGSTWGEDAAPFIRVGCALESLLVNNYAIRMIDEVEQAKIALRTRLTPLSVQAVRPKSPASSR